MRRVQTFIFWQAMRQATEWAARVVASQCCEFSVVSYWLCMKCATARGLLGTPALEPVNVVTGTCNTLKVGLTWNRETAQNIMLSHISFVGTTLRSHTAVISTLILFSVSQCKRTLFICFFMLCKGISKTGIRLC